MSNVPATFAVFIHNGTGVALLHELMARGMRPALVVTDSPYVPTTKQRKAGAGGPLWLLKRRLATHRQPYRMHNLFNTYYAAVHYGLPILAKPLLRTTEGVARLKAAAVDYHFVFTFGILKDDVLATARKACINFHNTLLPYRKGANPEFWIVQAEDYLNGFSFHYIDAGIDTGALIEQYPVALDPLDTSATLNRRLFQVGAVYYADFIVRMLCGLPVGNTPQANLPSTYDRKNTPADQHITPATMPRAELLRMVMASAHFGGALWEHNGRTHRVVSAQALTEQAADAAVLPPHAYIAHCTDGPVLLVTALSRK